MRKSVSFYEFRLILSSFIKKIASFGDFLGNSLGISKGLRRNSRSTGFFVVIVFFSAKELQCHTKSVKNWFIYKRKLATELPTLDILKTFCEEPRETEKIPEQTPQFQANTCNFLENHANPLNFLENPHDFLGISKEISKQWLEHALFLQNMAKVQHFCASFWQTPWIFANFLAELAIKRENLENSQ